MVSKAEQPACSLGGYDWLDEKASLRHWFANWLADHWRRIYSESLYQLHTKSDWDAYGAMEEFTKTIPSKLRRLSTAEQLAAVDAEARKFNFKTTSKRIENELRHFLTHAGKDKKHAKAFKASPWCDHFATTEHILQQAGKDITFRLYPDDPNGRMALESVISEFGSLEKLQVAPAMTQLFAVQEGFDQFNNTIKSLPGDSPISSALRTIEPHLQDISAALQAEINHRANEPSVSFTPLRIRRLQRRVHFAVCRLCRPKDGPDKLADFIQKLLMEWPRIYAGVELDLKEHFNPDQRRKLLRDYLGLAEGESNKEARALWFVLDAIVLRDELRSALLHLADLARRQAERRRKGWQHLRRALRIVFNHIGREPSDEEMFRNFERANYAHMRNVTWERRLRLFPELRGDPDHSVRDLSKKERMNLFVRYSTKKRSSLLLDGEGRNSFATRYGRAKKAVRKELGQE